MGTLSYRAGLTGGAGGQGSALWGCSNCSSRKAPLSSVSPALQSKAVKGNPRYHSTAQISLQFGISCRPALFQESQAKEKRFQMRHRGPEASRAHPWRRTSSDGAQGICWRRLTRRARKTRKDEKGEKKERTRDREGRERRKADACGGVGITEHHL